MFTFAVALNRLRKPTSTVYQDTTVKPKSSATSVQSAVNKTARIPKVTLGGQVEHATSPALSTQGRLPGGGGGMLGALPAPVGNALGGKIGGFRTKWLLLGLGVVVLIVLLRR